VLKLGDLELTVIFTLGHTNASSSYALTVEEGGKTYNAVIANMNTSNDHTRLVNNSEYPQSAEDYANTFAMQKTLDVDIWVAAHGAQYGLHDKLQPGDSYDPDRFVDPEGYLEAVEHWEQMIQQRLATQQAQ
jgi:metallo-beta-lactamase class B